MGIFDVTPKKETQEDVAGLPIDEQIVHALKQVFDPEIPVNIYDLGLIYRIDYTNDEKKAAIDMT